ncbi:FAD-linked oxidoreductase afoF [Diplonema papillatum]|nr:FAD-linked oxidoreductase afoF [Diplonema papillatum]
MRTSVLRHSLSNGCSLPLFVLALLSSSTCVSCLDTVTFSSLRHCLADSGLNFSVKGEFAYDDAYQFQLVSAPLEAVAIAFPTNAEQVAAALACAARQSVKVSALGGGHSFVGYGFGNPDNLVISMAAFTSVSFDESTGLVTYGGGARVGPVAKFLWDVHGRLVPHVRGSSVGLVGSAIGGGFGTTSRFLGSPTDNIVDVEYMLYNGTVVHGGPGSDLLWAAQGAGSSFGIILSMTSKTWLPAHSHGIIGDIRGADGSPEDADTMIKSFLAVQEYALTDAPRTLGLRVYSNKDFRVASYFYGDPAEYEAAMKPLIDRLPINVTHNYESQTFWEMDVATTGSGMNAPNGGVVGVRAFYTQSLATTADKPLTYDEMEALVANTVFGASRSGIRANGYFFDLWGGVFADIKDEDTSFAHGNNLWVVRVDGRLSSGPDRGEEFVWPEDLDGWLKNTVLPFEEKLTAAGHKLRGFANYRDRQLSEAEWSSRLYGNNYLRLLNIKAAVDPTGVFTSNAQSIPVKSLSERVKVCLTAAGVEAAIKGEFAYDDAYQFQLVSAPLEAVAIAFPTNAEQVAAALACAARQSVKVSALGGGHSFVGYGFGNPDNLVISMAAFTSVSFDESTGLVTYGGGARVGPVAKFLWDVHGRLVPHVRGSSVGLVGSAIGGGFGTTSRFLGSPTDNIVDVEYMLYNGTVVHGGPGSDLLWAAQGAGSSFGIILSMTSKTWLPAHSHGIIGDIRGADGSPEDADTMIKSFLAVQEYALTDAPRTLGLRVYSNKDFRVASYFYGDPAEYEAAMKPLIDRLPINVTHNYESQTFWEMDVATTGSGMNAPNGGVVGVRAFYTQSLATTADKPLTYDEMEALVANTVFGASRSGIRANGYFFDLWGGVFADIKDEDTSFAHGNNLWVVRVDGRLSSGPDRGEEFVWPEDLDGWLKNTVLPFEEKLTAAGHKLRGFANYRDRQLSEAEWSSRLYGNNYLRLLNIKAAVDPTGVFTSNAQSIPVKSLSERVKVCLTAAGVEAAIKGEFAYDDAYQFQLVSAPLEAVAIAFPTNAEQVAAALACAARQSVKVSALGGGHSFVGYGFGNPDNLVISMAAFTSVSFDESTGLVTYGGGARVGPVAKFLWDVHGRLVPHVRGSSVGLVGSAIGGGFGTTSRFLGSPTDNIVDVEYMLYNGTVVHGGPGSDLLWAAQGAGSSFGIILSMTSKTWLPAHSHGIIGDIRGADGSPEDADTMIKSFLAVQEYALTDAPRTLGLRVYSNKDFRVASYFYGDPAEYEAAMKPLIDRLPINVTHNYESQTFWEMDVATTGSGMNAPNGGVVGVRAFYTQSLATTADKPLTYDEMEALVANTVFGASRSGIRANGYFFDLWGGVFADIKDEDTSFAHGNNLWVVRVDGRLSSGPDRGEEFVWPEDLDGWLKNTVLPFEAKLTAAGHKLRGFANYRDRQLSEAEWSSRLYGNNYLRLLNIKAAVDPTGVFTSNAQSIPVKSLSERVKVCLTAAGVEAAIKGEFAYDDAYQFQLVSAPLEAVAIAFPTNAEQVAAALACAARQSVKVSALGGGHSFVGYGFGNPDNLVISMAAFTSVSFDESTGLVTYGGGARVGPVAKFLWDVHGRLVPHVRGSSVGLVGSAIGGGFGTTSRFLGSPTDNIVDVEYMLYNGTVVHGGPGSDLLWAAQGAGSSFGIILSMTSKTWLPAHSHGIIGDIRGADGSPEDADTMIKSFLAVQEYALTDAPRTLGLRVYSNKDFRVASYFYGDPAEYEAAMKPLIDRLPINVTHNYESQTFWEMDVATTGSGMNAPNGGVVGVRAFYTQSLATTADKPLTYDEMEALVANTVFGASRSGIRANGYFFDLWGGVFADIKDEDTSFAHGNNLWVVRVDGRLSSGPDRGEEFVWPEDLDGWLKNTVLPFEEKLTAAGHKLRGFANYRDRQLSEAEWSSRLYGNNYLRLLNIKAAVDPTGVFTSNAQSIPVKSLSVVGTIAPTRKDPTPGEPV